MQPVWCTSEALRVQSRPLMVLPCLHHQMDEEIATPHVQLGLSPWREGVPVPCGLHCRLKSLALRSRSYIAPVACIHALVARCVGIPDALWVCRDRCHWSNEG